MNEISSGWERGRGEAGVGGRAGRRGADIPTRVVEKARLGISVLAGATFAALKRAEGPRALRDRAIDAMV